MAKIVYNPLHTDFTVNWDGKPYTATALGITNFEENHIADHVRHHLAKAVLNQRGVKTNYEDDLKKCMDLVSGDIENV